MPRLAKFLPTLAGLRSPPRRPRPRRKHLYRLALLALLALFGWEALRVVAGRNFHAVIEGRVYRSAQPSPEALAELIRDRGVRTVVNLRGCCEGFDWYAGECRATHAGNVVQEDVTLSASRLPPPAELRRLVEVLDRAEQPVLLHCRRGADRTGLASGLALLLYTDASPSDAARHHGLRFGHVGLGRTGNVDRFFALYEGYLAANGLAHSPEVFRRWVLHEYRPGPCWADLELGEPPTVLRVGDAPALPLRATNRSHEVWHLRPGTGTGVHVRYLLCSAAGGLEYVGYAGLFRRDVAPGETVPLTVALPPLRAPGKYVLVIDMIDGEGCAFSQAGSEALIRELIVRE
ncbi:MAG TPA: tyrosine-protein phosphatase [Gemmataceae bacterium]